MEIVKINTQMQTGSNPKGSWEIAKELGLRGVYKGTAATLMRDVPFSFIFFPLSTYAKQRLNERDRANGWEGKPKFASVFWGSVIAGVIAAVTVTPADVIKTRLQTKSANGVQYNGIAHAAREIYAKEGVSAFFKGSAQRAGIIAPLFGIAMLVYEAQQRMASNWNEKK
jgi:solute carrier family 25 aspartate/glutamate transporter 12/13